MKKKKKLRRSVINRPSFQEEKGNKMAWVFPSSSNRPLSLKCMPVLAEYCSNMKY